MKVFRDITEPEIVDLLRANKVGIIRTDTLYGLVAKAESEQAVTRIYNLKTRTPTKPLLILISDSTQLLDPYDTSQFENNFWPGKNSIILPSPTAPDYLTRGTKTLAYRIPNDETLKKLLSQTGPLVAPSANPEAETPARTVQEAINYFGDNVDFYVDGGEVMDNTPSKLWLLKEDSQLEQLR